VVRWLHLKGVEYCRTIRRQRGRRRQYIRARRTRRSAAWRATAAKKSLKRGAAATARAKAATASAATDLVIDVPVGSLVHNRDTREVHEVLKRGPADTHP
jgi:GTPase involved in cell partitioning and DNA repair